MTTITFVKADDSALMDGINYVTENGLHWTLFDTDQSDVSLLTQVIEQGSGLDSVGGEGSLTVSAVAGNYVMLIQSPVNNAINSFNVVVT